MDAGRGRQSSRHDLRPDSTILIGIAGPDRHDQMPPGRRVFRKPVQLGVAGDVHGRYHEDGVAPDQIRGVVRQLLRLDHGRPHAGVEEAAMQRGDDAAVAPAVGLAPPGHRQRWLELQCPPAGRRDEHRDRRLRLEIEERGTHSAKLRAEASDLVVDPTGLQAVTQDPAPVGF
jgi:hypothetical protein